MNTIKEHIKKNEYKNCYLLYGSDDYMKNLYKKKLKSGLLGSGDEMNYAYYNGEKLDLNSIVTMAETMPFFSDRRVIFIEESGLFKEANELSDAMGQFPDTTFVVFVESTIDKRNKLYKYVSKNGYVSEMNGLKEDELMTFAASELNKHGKKISGYDCSYLLSRIGYDMNTIHNECEKLSSYLCDRDVVTKEDIDAICIVTLENKIFDMLDCIASGKKERALVLYNNLIALKESPIKILSLVTRHYNILYKLYLARGKGVEQGTLASDIGIPSFAVKKYGYQLGKFNKESLLKILQMCLEIDEKSKSGRVDPQVGVEMLIVTLTNI